MSVNNKLHNDDVEINDTIVKNLISEQFPQFTDLPIRRVNSTGTVNAIYRLGEEYCIRLPRSNRWIESLHHEWDVLPAVSKQVTITVPEVIEKGKPNADYPLEWAIYKWISGNIYDKSAVSEAETAEILAQFVNELHSIHVSGNEPKAGRKPLRELDEMTITAIQACNDDIDVEAALAVWRESLQTEPWDGNPVWIHADLLKPNLLVNEGRLAAVIDFGSAGIGDPAFDVIPAWAVLTSEARELFRSLLHVDDNTWARAKAYALHQAALIIPYYRESNPAFVVQAKNTIANIL